MPERPISPKDFLHIVEAAIQAPSADNHLPFSFDSEESRVRVWSTEAWSVFPYHRRVLALISLGAVLENMVVRAGSLGYRPSVNLFPQHSLDLLATIELTTGDAKSDPLISGIAGRHTNRRFFHGPPLPLEQQQAFEKEAKVIDGAHLTWLDSTALRRQAVALVHQAEAERFRDESMHRELFSSIRFDSGWDRPTEDGLAPGSLEVERPLRGAFMALRRWRLMQSLSRIGGHHLLALRAAALPCRFSPHLGVIGTSLDSDDGIVAAGRALERIWLLSSASGLAFQPLVASTLLALDGYAGVRADVRRGLAEGWRRLTPGMLPLVVFRLGRGAAARVRSGRRQLASYLRGSRTAH